MAASALKSIRGRLSGSLRARVMLLTLAAFVAVAVPAAVSFNWIVNTTVLRLGTMFAERQIQYDRYRGLEALTREVALAETLMRAPAILEWAQNEFDRDFYARGIAELEHFRRTFVDGSYFFVVGASGNYYFNDKAGSYTGNQKRYTLSPDNPRDGWYYKTVSSGPGCHLNVDHDDVLAVTKVWMNCVVEERGKVLGIVGTGIDLTLFLRTVVESRQPGIESMFVDRDGAVQANRDASMIDFHSLTKDVGAKKTVFQLLDADEDRATFRDMMDLVAGSHGEAEARFVSLEGRDVLVGVGYLDELGWYNVTVMDVDAIIDRDIFVPLGALIVLTMLSAAALVTWLFKRSVLDRLKRAEAAVGAIEGGDFSRTVGDPGDDEIGRLARALDRMTRAVGADRASLEAAVQERTRQLERIAYVDQLSGVLNRRGFVEAFRQDERRRMPDSALPGLLVLDIDNFKAINDSHGHAVGDEVIAEVARRLIDVTREHDLCARWGGDEFVVILSQCDPQSLTAVGSKILDEIRSRPLWLDDGTLVRVSTSIGAHLVTRADTLESAASKADIALYAAKRQGRNRLVVYDPRTHGDAVIGKVA